MSVVRRSALGGKPMSVRLFVLFVIAASSFLSSAACKANAQDTPPLRVKELLAAGKPVTIVCFGDSITGVYYHTGGRRAYPEMLELALKKVHTTALVKVINAGVSG